MSLDLPEPVALQPLQPVRPSVTPVTPLSSPVPSPASAWPRPEAGAAEPADRAAAPAALRRICVEGWRGVNHSIAMVNQHQLLVMLREPGWQLWHRDRPYFMKHWNPQQMPAGFAAADQAAIAAIPAPEPGQRFDALLRIASPFPAEIDPLQKTLTFMVTEVGLLPDCFDRTNPDLAAFTRDGNRVVTPSRWSRERLCAYGLAPEGVVVVPHGVDVATFAPLAPASRLAVRQALGIADDELLIANVGVATWNKGLDLLIKAFATVRQRHPRLRLLLKDHQQLYGIGADRTLAMVARQNPGLIDDRTLAGISLISGSLDQAQLRGLYCAADAYVSPYRAEGFNLPVLEALACGTPVLVTDGGPTDDFCPAALSSRIAARDGVPADEPNVQGVWREPSLDALIAALEALCEGRLPGDAHEAAAREAARQQLVARHAWAAVTRPLMDLM